MFDIQLAEKFVNKAIDGWFRTPAALACASVNVKYRSSSSKRLDIKNSVDLNDHPRFYLAFRGPKLSRGQQAKRHSPS